MWRVHYNNKCEVTMSVEVNINNVIATKKDEIKELLKDINKVSNATKKEDIKSVEIDFSENPLNPDLLSYCFDNILGFDVKYRIFEKVNYIIEFDYIGTLAYARAGTH